MSELSLSISHVTFFQAYYMCTILNFALICIGWLFAAMRLHYGDMTDSTCLVKLIADIQPTEIYNLAAQSHVKVRL